MKTIIDYPKLISNIETFVQDKKKHLKALKDLFTSLDKDNPHYNTIKNRIKFTTAELEVKSSYLKIYKERVKEDEENEKQLTRRREVHMPALIERAKRELKLSGNMIKKQRKSFLLEAITDYNTKTDSRYLNQLYLMLEKDLNSVSL